MRGHWHWTVKVTERDGTVRALEAVWYVPEARYNLKSIRVLDEEGCRIQVQQGVVIASQGDRVILKGVKCGGLYKLKKENSVRDRVLRISLEGSSSRVKLQGRLQRDVTGSKCCEKEKWCIQVRSEMAQAIVCAGKRKRELL